MDKQRRRIANVTGRRREPALVGALAALLVACHRDPPAASTDASASTATSDTTDTNGTTGTTDMPGTTGTTGMTGSMGTSGGDADADLAATIAALCPGYADLFCGAPCGCAEIPGFPQGSACQGHFEAQCAARLEGYLAVVVDGQAEFRPDGARACLANFAPLAAACVPFPQDLFFLLCPVLAPIPLPDLPGLAEPCTGVCAPGLRCGSEGECVTPGPVDAACLSAYDCDPALVCTDGACAPPDHAASGQACAPGECSGETSCLASARKLCRAPASGGPCEGDHECPPGEWCDAGGSDTCTPGGGLGEPCGNGVVCQVDLACDLVTTTCQALPELGQPCALGPQGPFVCADGLACVDGSCDAPPAEGEPCGQGSPACAAGLGCAFEEKGSYCRTKAGPGAICQNDDTCAVDLFCDFGSNTCTPHLAPGEPCTDGNECGPGGACLPDAAFIFRCAARPGLDEACFLDECEAGLYCKTPYEAGLCAPRLCEMILF